MVRHCCCYYYNDCEDNRRRRGGGREKARVFVVLLRCFFPTLFLFFFRFFCLCLSRSLTLSLLFPLVLPRMQTGEVAQKMEKEGTKIIIIKKKKKEINKKNVVFGFVRSFVIVFCFLLLFICYYLTCFCYYNYCYCYPFRMRKCNNKKEKK